MASTQTQALVATAAAAEVQEVQEVQGPHLRVLQWCTHSPRPDDNQGDIYCVHEILTDTIVPITDLDDAIYTYLSSTSSSPENKQDKADNNHECPICLGPYLDHDTLLCLPCTHIFHMSCILPFAQRTKTCAYCRTAISDSPIVIHDNDNDNDNDNNDDTQRGVEASSSSLGSAAALTKNQPLCSGLRYVVERNVDRNVPLAMALILPHLGNSSSSTFKTSTASATTTSTPSAATILAEKVIKFSLLEAEYEGLARTVREIEGGQEGVGSIGGGFGGFGGIGVGDKGYSLATIVEFVGEMRRHEYLVEVVEPLRAEGEIEAIRALLREIQLAVALIGVRNVNIPGNGNGNGNGNEEGEGDGGQ